jgi:hypothetical protein
MCSIGCPAHALAIILAPLTGPSGPMTEPVIVAVSTADGQENRTPARINLVVDMNSPGKNLLLVFIDFDEKHSN